MTAADGPPQEDDLPRPRARAVTPRRPYTPKKDAAANGTHAAPAESSPAQAAPEAYPARFREDIREARGLPPEDWKREIAEILFSRFRLILATAAVILAGAAAVAFGLPPTYSAAGSVLVCGKSPSVRADALEGEGERPTAVEKEDLQTEIAILTSPEVIRLAAGVKEGGPAPTPEQEERIELLRKDLEVEVVPASNVIAVRLESRDSRFAEETLDAVLRHYLAFRVRAFHPRAQEVFLTERAERYRKDLEEMEARLERLGGKAAATLLDREAADNMDRLGALMRQLGDLRGARAEADEVLRPLERALGAGPVDERALPEGVLAKAGDVDAIRRRLLTLRRQRAETGQLFPDDHPAARVLDASIESAERELRAEVERVVAARRAEALSLDRRAGEVEAEIAALDARNAEIQKASAEIQRLGREAEILEFNYQTFAKRGEEARIKEDVARAIVSDEVNVLSWAKSSAEVVFPRKLPTMAIGLVAGVLAGLGLCLLFELLDQTVKRPSDVARTMKLPVILSIRKV